MKVHLGPIFIPLQTDQPIKTHSCMEWYLKERSNFDVFLHVFRFVETKF